MDELAEAIRGLSNNDPEPRLAARAAAVATLFDETQVPAPRRNDAITELLWAIRAVCSGAALPIEENSPVSTHAAETASTTNAATV